MIDLKLYPKSKGLLQEFAKRNLLAFQKNIMKELPVEGLEIPEITDEMAEQYANALITTNLRILYDFFSENNIYIKIAETPNDCMGSIYGDDEEGIFKSRLEAEDAVFDLAFKKLEEL